MKTVAAVVLASVVGCACACANPTEGTPSASPAMSATASSSRLTPTGTSSTTPATSSPTAFDPGVVETTKVPLTPMAQTCESAEREPGAQQVSFVQGSRPDTPTIELLTPQGWTSTPSQDDPTLRLTGPDGLSGTVTVASTPLGPAEAFGKYSDDAMAKAPIATLSLLPAELCGYSGQKLMGTWSNSDGKPVQYRDRIAHVWTAGDSYLVAIHLEGPQGAPGFADAEELMMRDFGIRIP
jgi:hypothetical protein